MHFYLRPALLCSTLALWFYMGDLCGFFVSQFGSTISTPRLVISPRESLRFKNLFLSLNFNELMRSLSQVI
jgi:hypothetical protein